MTAASASTSARTSAPDAATTAQRPRPDRNLAVELVRATEAAAMASAGWLGRGDKNQVDGAAVDAMRPVLGTVSMRGVVVIGEGEKDNAPMLYNGEEVGDGNGPEVDIAVDPIDGTTLAAMALPDALSVVALSERGRMFDPGPVRVHAQDRRSRGSGVRRRPGGSGRRRSSPRWRRRWDGRPTTSPSRSSTDLGTSISWRRSAPPAPASDSCGTATSPARSWWRPSDMDTGVDLLLGTGGTPEGVIAAAALRCLGGEIFARLAPRDDGERDAALELGYDLDKILTTKDLVGGNDVFFAATGVTDGALLQGVRFGTGRVTTYSLSMRARSGTIRRIETYHDPNAARLVPQAWEPTD